MGCVVAIVGATGAVGAEFSRCMQQRNFPVSELRLLASPRSAGKVLRAGGKELTVGPLNEKSFRGVEIAMFSAGGSVSKIFAPQAVAAGATVIDNSSAFRMDPDVPLVVPEINPQAIGRHKGIIANPNCSTIIALVPLWPIYRVNPITRIIAATYQAASGAGAAAMEELREGTRAELENRPFQQRVFPHPYAFNVFSHNSKIDPETGYNEEELKMLRETRKIFNDDAICISATCVRVPVLRAHCEALNVTCQRPVAPAEARRLLAAAPGVKLVDEPEKNLFPMPRDASGQGDVLVGRIRQDSSDPSGRSLALFVAGDQLLKGAALNAVQIAEYLVRQPGGAMALARYKLTIAYDGTAYKGWQRQAEPIPTVQRAVERAAGQILNCPVTIHGSSRTDTGVHATGQIAHMDADTHIDPYRLRRAINSRLAGDVDVRELEPVSPDFDASRAVRKRYRYLIWRSRHRPLFWRHFVYDLPYHVDLNTMQQACGHFVGVHDFISFRGKADERQTTVRTIFHCGIHRRGPWIVFAVEGSGFLYHMVRTMVGTVLEVGRGHYPPARVPEILAAKDRAAAGPCMPPGGLCLQWIRFAGAATGSDAAAAGAGGDAPPSPEPAAAPAGPAFG